MRSSGNAKLTEICSATHVVSLSLERTERQSMSSTGRPITPTSKSNWENKIRHGHRTLSANHAKKAYDFGRKATKQLLNLEFQWFGVSQPVILMIAISA